MANVGKSRSGFVFTQHHRSKPRKVTAATRRRGDKPADRVRGDVDTPNLLSNNRHFPDHQEPAKS